MAIKFGAEMESIIAANPDLQRFREIEDRGLGPTETAIEQILVIVETYLRESGRQLPTPVCEHQEEWVLDFYDTDSRSTEHAEWCSACGASRIVSGFSNKPWTLPKRK